MKIEIKEESKLGEVKYPCLMKAKHDDTIILFTDEKVGVVVNGSEYNHVGEYSEKWGMPLFIPFKGSITLSND